MTRKEDRDPKAEADRESDDKPRLEKELLKDLDVSDEAENAVRGGDSRAASGGWGTDHCDTR